MARWHKVGSVADFPVGKLCRVRVDGESLVVTQTIKGWFAFIDMCSHADVPLATGHLEDAEQGPVIVCRAHGAKFSLLDGRVLHAPAVSPIQTFPVAIDGESVTLDIAAL